MRISVISGGYAFTDTIDKTGAVGGVQPNSGTPKIEDSDFAKTLKEIQDTLNTKLDSGTHSVKTYGQESDGTKVAETQASEKTSDTKADWKSYTGKVPQVVGEAGTNNITVRTSTSDDYESIAPPNLQALFKEASNTYGIDQKLLELIGYHESRFKSDVVSSSGAVGIMQLMPDTAKSMGVNDSYNVRDNIMGGAKLLNQLYEAYNGDLDLMLSGYSAGMGAVKRHGGVPPFKETTDYIKWIRERYP